MSSPDSEARMTAIGADIEYGTASPSSEEDPMIIEPSGMTRSQAFNLYTSHFLSTWNIRTYEFAAIIFTAAAYPETLTAASTRGIVRTIASICFSSMVGSWVDHGKDRLRTLLSTISVNRISVITASCLWFFIVDSSKTPNEGPLSQPPFPNLPMHELIKGGIFAAILFLGILENLSASGNMMSMERDWVIVASAPDSQPYDLTHLNSIMRRIDLICKLLAPILISVIISTTGIKIGVIVVGVMSASTWGIEIFCARRVWSKNPKLQVPREIPTSQDVPEVSPGFLMKTKMGIRRYVLDFKNYFSAKVWIPSISLALLHLSSLSYGATFITFLLSVGFSLDIITLARAVGSVVEISSTIVTPVGVHYLGKAKNHGRFRGEDRVGLLNADGLDDSKMQTETGLERLGLWGIYWQLLNLVPVVLALWSLSPKPTPLPGFLTTLLPFATTASTSRTVLTLTLFTFLSLSRLGLWIFDLTTQQLTQTLLPSSQRSSFTGVEYSFVSVFELCQHLVVIIWNKPEMFKWIAIGSWSAVCVSSLAYTGWVWWVRGHLVHWDRLGGKCGKGRH